MKIITYENFIKILDSSLDQSLISLLKIAFITGLRINEISQLIQKGRKSSIGDKIRIIGKGKKNIDQVLTEEIKNEIALIKNNWKNGSSISKSIQRWNAKYSLEIELHSIRRLSATFIDMKFDSRHAQALLNHSNVETTEKYIAKSNSFFKKNEAQKILSKALKEKDYIETRQFLLEKIKILELEIKKLKEKQPK